MYANFVSGKKGNLTVNLQNTTDYLAKENNMLDGQVKTMSKLPSDEIEKCMDYLSKENERFSSDEHFFTNDKMEVSNEEVVQKLGDNAKGLKNSEAKFFMSSVSPSKEELKHIKDGIEQFCKNNKTVSEAEKELLLKQHLKSYAKLVMDSYAKNFEREGVNSANDLVWYGKVEKYRYWKHDSPEVVSNNLILKDINKLQRAQQTPETIAKMAELNNKLNRDQDRVIYSNMPKSGDNYHLHILISRRDVAQKRSLSPRAQFKSSEKHVVNGTSCKAGFDRVRFCERIEKDFDSKFGYIRDYEQSIKGKITLKKYMDEKKKAIKDLAKICKDIKILPWKENDNFAVKKYSISDSLKEARQRNIEWKDLYSKISTDKVLYDVKNQIWEKRNPHTPRPYYMTEQGQSQMNDIKYKERRGLDISKEKTAYVNDRNAYNTIHEIPSNKIQSNKQQNIDARNIVKSIGKGVGNNLFSEIHFNDLSKVVTLSLQTYKTVKKHRQLEQIQRALKTQTTKEFNIIKNNTTSKLTITQTAANQKINTIAQTYANKAITKTIETIGKKIADKAVMAANPYVASTLKIAMAIPNMVKNAIDHEHER